MTAPRALPAGADNAASTANTHAAPAGASLMALAMLNFFLADARDGLGPFLDAYLSTKGWQSMDLGVLATACGVIGLLAGLPAGALADRSRHKRAMIVLPVALITLGAFLCIAFPDRWMVFGSQALAAVAGVLIMPALVGITLGVVGGDRFGAQLGKNEAYNHAGNIVLLGGTWAASVWFGLPGVAALMLVTTVAAIAATLAISPGAIDHAAARGMAAAGKDTGAQGGAKASPLSALYHNKPLLLLSVSLLLFHFGNAPLARLIAQQFAVQMQKPFETTAVITMVSQLAALAAALAAPWIIKRGLVRPAVVLAMLTLPLRGVLAWAFSDFAMIYPAQLLDGVGVGLLGILTPFLVERLTRGSGHFNLALAAVMMVQGLGAASSNVVAGYLVARHGYPVTYLLHGAVALAALAAFVPMRRGDDGR
ncbi:Predicted arabinose efflux permease, MFS family [Duganella sp. CF517]|uniref:MFS transporter n=1 Tax=Duganella sp. CF517 TaxID=1881038 RepID=UPI0008BC06ED|nr:MFS transporter [Duganella sp. CF517]SEN33469.1 Predicted arabinose efflux permease, MFS family [Duganella sp. CF517]